MSGALRFEARVRVIANGGVRSARGDAVVVRDADAVTLLIAAATSYRTYEDVSADPAARVAAALDPASHKDIDTLRAAHVRDYQQLFNRVTIDLGSSKRVPTDERVGAFADGDDPGLAALYFQYGRYMLIASSRTGSQPANLQGLWNDSMTCSTCTASPTRSRSTPGRTPATLPFDSRSTCCRSSAERCRPKQSSDDPIEGVATLRLSSTIRPYAP